MATDSEDLVLSISADTRQIMNAMKRLERAVGASSSQMEKQFAAVGRGIDKAMPTGIQERINKMVGAQTAATKEWTGALANQSKEMEKLRARFNPMFSTITSYKTAVREIQTAHRLGALSAEEMTSAIQRERQAALSSIAALKQRKAALMDTPNVRGSNFNTSNLAAQGFDIASTAAFMPFYTVALQQGPQVAQVFNDIKSSGQSIGPAVAGAFMQIINPVSLATIGVIAAGAALIQYITSASKVETLDEILARHEANIKRLGPAYEYIRKKANEYATDPSVVNALTGDDMKKAQAKLKDEIGNTLRSIEAEMLQFAARTGGSLTGQRFAPAQEIINSLREGKLAIGDFLREVTALEQAGKLRPDAASSLREYSLAADDVARVIAGMQGEITEAEVALNNMSKVLASDATNALSRLTDEQRKYIEGLIEGLKSGKTSSDEFRAALEALALVSPDFSGTIGQLQNLTTALDTARIAAGDFVNTTAKTSRIGRMGDMEAEFDNAFNMWRRFGYGDDAGVERKFTQPKAAKKAAAPKKTADDRFFEDIEAIKQRTIALAEERAQLGLSYEAQQKRKIAFDLEQKALKDVREAARQKGDQDWQNAQLTPEQIRQIDEVSAAYARQAAELKNAEAQSQAFENLFGMGASALEAIVSKSEKAEDALKKLIVQLALAAAQAALLGSGPLAGLFGGGGLGGMFMPDIFAYAKGTNNHPGGPALINERGGEIVNLPNGTQVIPHDVSVKAMRGAANQNVSNVFAPVIQASGNAASDDRLLAELRKMFDREFTPRTRAALREIKLKSGGRV